MADAPDLPHASIALARLERLLGALASVLCAEQDARCALAHAVPDSSFGNTDLLWAVRRLLARLQCRGDDASEGETLEEVLEHLALLHAELIIGLHARRHEVAPWLSSTAAGPAATALLARYAEAVDRIDGSVADAPLRREAA